MVKHKYSANPSNSRLAAAIAASLVGSLIGWLSGWLSCRLVLLVVGQLLVAWVRLLPWWLDVFICSKLVCLPCLQSKVERRFGSNNGRWKCRTLVLGPYTHKTVWGNYNILCGSCEIYIMASAWFNDRPDKLTEPRLTALLRLLQM